MARSVRWLAILVNGAHPDDDGILLSVVHFYSSDYHAEQLRSCYTSCAAASPRCTSNFNHFEATSPHADHNSLERAGRFIPSSSTKLVSDQSLSQKHSRHHCQDLSWCYTHLCEALQPTTWKRNGTSESSIANSRFKGSPLAAEPIRFKRAKPGRRGSQHLALFRMQSVGGSLQP